MQPPRMERMARRAPMGIRPHALVGLDGGDGPEAGGGQFQMTNQALGKVHFRGVVGPQFQVHVPAGQGRGDELLLVLEANGAALPHAPGREPFAVDLLGLAQAKSVIPVPLVTLIAVPNGHSAARVL